AVFKSDDANTVHFAGGFAVVPTGATAPIAFTRDVTDPGNGGGGGGGEEVTGTTAYQAWATSLGNDLRDSDYTTPEGATVDFIRLNDRNGKNDIVATNFDFANTNSNFSETLFLTGSTTSGVVYGQGLFNGSVQLYAGLLPTTDLGTPLADGFTAATWTGSIAGFNGAGTAIASTSPLKLAITFAGTSGTIDTVGAPFIQGNGGIFFGLTFTGTFDANGVMSGTTTGAYGNTTTGTFNGLIGTNGAVGLFRSISATPAQSYIGGFQAKP
nr:hypothetical protein [Pseudomonadota bacterium]